MLLGEGGGGEAGDGGGTEEEDGNGTLHFIVSEVLENSKVRVGNSVLFLCALRTSIDGDDLFTTFFHKEQNLREVSLSHLLGAEE